MDPNAKESAPNGEVKPEQPEQPFQMGFVDQLGTFALEIKLYRVQPAMALGLLVQATDIVKQWYPEVLRQKRALGQKSLSVQAREGLARVGKLFIPRA